MHPGPYPPPHRPPSGPVPPGRFHPGQAGPVPEAAPRYGQPRPVQARARMRVRWEASPPPGALPPRRAARPVRYTGPPAYPSPPRWGFPALVWRPSTAVPGTASDVGNPLHRLRTLSRNAIALLWLLTGLAVITAGAEVWRYVLLALSRSSGLSSGVVATSDALVLAGSLLTFVVALLALAATVWWLFVARQLAADVAGEDPPRPVWQVALGLLVPGVNLVQAGAILSELEHAVLRRPADRRPRPSRLVLGWWAALVGNGLLFALTIWWRARDGVQAEADGVVLTALVDLSAAGLAALTALLVLRLTRLLAPIDEARLRPLRVLRVSGAPEPELRAHRPASAAR